MTYEQQIERQLERINVLNHKQRATVTEVVTSYDLPANRLAEFADALKMECVSGRPFTAYGAAHHICAVLTTG